MRYHNLDLWIEAKREGGYPLRASCAAHGESRDVLTLDPAELQEPLRRLEAGETDQEFLLGFGRRLHDALLATPRVGPHFDACCAAARDPEEGVRLRLRIEPPEIAALPWEYLYSTRDDCFLAASIHTPLVRYLELSQRIRELATTPPLRMLVLIPEGTGAGAAREKTHLLAALEELKDQVELTFLERGVTRTAISDLLLEQQVHLLHFIGHGEFDEKGFLLLNGEEEGEDDLVDHERFASLFLNHPPLKLVVLNACEGARVSSTRSFVGMAPQIVKQGIPAVVAMQYEIYDREAVRFAREFYRSLFRGWNRGRVEIAMSHARNTLAAEFPESRAVGAPVLFLHTPEGVLFDVVQGSGLRDLPLARQEAHTQREVLRTREHNLRLLREQQRHAPDAGLSAALRSEEAELGRVRRRLRFRNLALGCAAAVGLLLFFLLNLQLLERLPARIRLETYGMWLGDAFASKRVADELALVALDAAAQERQRGAEFGSWRVDDARVIAALAQAGARVIALDLRYERPSAHDTALLRALGEARSRGSAVILGVNTLVEGRPLLAPGFEEAASGWAALCIGSRGLHSAKIAPLLIARAGSSGPRAVPSLALSAVAALRGARALDLDARHRQVNLLSETTAPLRIGVAEVSRIRREQRGCPIIAAGDTLAELFIDYSPLRMLRDPRRRLVYDDVLDPARAEALRGAVAGRIVVVGEESPQEEFSTLRGTGSEVRYGYELHADAVNTILQGITIRPLRGGAQLLVLLLLAALAALLVYLFPDRGRLRLALLATLVAAYLAVAVLLYAERRLLLLTFYHVAALLLTYWLVRRLQRRWFS